MENIFKNENIGVIDILERILDVVYQQLCGICGKINTKSLCNKCKIKLEKEFLFITDSYKTDLQKNFVEHHYFFKYDDLIRKLILSLKFHEKPYIYKTISYFLQNNQKNFENLKKYDIIIIVPISKKRQKERGYNQSELFAREISDIINAQIIKNILHKMKETPPQSTLNKKQREENVKNVYKVGKIQKIMDKRILLVDDIYTTGNTINECARILVQAGIDRKQIGVLTIAKD